MTQPFSHLRPSTLMPPGSSCSWYQRTGTTESSAGDDSAVYADAVDIACMPGPLSRKWAMRFPDADLTGTMEIWFADEAAAAIRAEDKIEYASIAYLVLDTESYHGAGYSAVVQRIEGVSP